MRLGAFAETSRRNHQGAELLWSLLPEISSGAAGPLVGLVCGRSVLPEDAGQVDGLAHGTVKELPDGLVDPRYIAVAIALRRDKGCGLSPWVEAGH